MFYNSLEFKAMQSRLDALSLQKTAILNNLANYETPGYKAQTVTFEQVLDKEGRRFQAKIQTDETTAARPDGNNVDSDAQSLLLYQNYVQSLYLYEKLNSQFSNVRYVLNQFAK